MEYITGDGQTTSKEQKVKQFFFPYFSEIEVITLFFILLLVAIPHREVVFDYLLHTHQPSLVFAILLIIIVVKAAVTKSPLSKRDRRYIVGPFYFAVGLTAFAGVMTSIPYTFGPFFSQSLLKIGNDLLLMVAGIRYGVMSFGGVVGFRRESESFFAEQFREDQMSPQRLLLTLVVICVLYFAFLHSYNIYSQITLMYFYTMSVIDFPFLKHSYSSL